MSNNSNDTNLTQQRNHANHLRSLAFHAALKSLIQKRPSSNLLPKWFLVNKFHNPQISIRR
jgi:hypothetical protein